MDTVSFADAFRSLWAALAPALQGPPTTIMTWTGVIIVVVDLVGFIWKKRRPGSKIQIWQLVVSLIIGILLLAPGAIIPLVLSLIIDPAVNLVIAIATGAK